MGSVISLSVLGMLDEAHARELTQEILDVNEVSSQYGFALTEAEAADLVATRARTLTDYGRVELGLGTEERLIDVFSQSPAMSGDSYAAALNTLLETFYYIKSATYDGISDTDLFALMREKFDGVCNGSADLLRDRFAEVIVRHINNKNNGIEEDEVDFDPANGIPLDEPGAGMTQDPQ